MDPANLLELIDVVVGPRFPEEDDRDLADRIALAGVELAALRVPPPLHETVFERASRLAEQHDA